MADNGLYIKHACIVNHDSIKNDASIFIEGGKIKFVGCESDFPAPAGSQVIDALGKYVLPGGIDPHTHFELEFGGTVSADDFYHGTRAAVAGGTTTIIDFVIPQKGEPLLNAYEKWRSRADPKAVCDFGLHCAITWWSPLVSDQMEILCNNKGISSFKMFMAYKDLFMLDDSELYETFERCRDLGVLAQVHAENGDIIAKNTKKLLENGITGPEGKTIYLINNNFPLCIIRKFYKVTNCQEPKTSKLKLQTVLALSLIRPTVHFMSFMSCRFQQQKKSQEQESVGVKNSFSVKL